MTGMGCVGEGGLRPALRVAVIINGLAVPRWIAWTLAEIEQADFVELVGVAVTPLTTGGDRPRAASSVVAAALYRTYEHLDRLLFRAREDALEEVDVALTVDPGRVADRRTTRGSGSASDMPFNLRDGAGVDVVLDLGSPADASWASEARYGVWRVRHGDAARYGGLPVLFGETYENDAVSTAALEVRTPDGAFFEHSSTYCATDPISLHRTRNRILASTPRLVLRALRDLHDAGAESVRSAVPRAGYVGDPRLPKVPTSRQLVAHFARVAARAAGRRLIHMLFDSHWFVAYRLRNSSGSEQASSFCVIPSPFNRSFMDPFLWSSGGKHFVFFEDQKLGHDRAVISYREICEGGARFSAPRTALSREYHLSYPFVFGWRGSVYMIPETAENQTIELYRAERFPDRWTLAHVLMRGVIAVDSTLVRWNGKFWLFTNCVEGRTTVGQELFVFWSDSLTGTWRPHKKNPVIADVRTARMGGRLFEKDGALIRPGQDSSRRYGYAVVFNRIDVLTEAQYEEVAVGRIEPDWLPRNRGSHCYDFDDLYEVTDGRRLTLRLPSGVRVWGERRRRNRNQA